MSDLRDLDREVTKISSGSQNDDAKRTWYSRIFNTLEWLSFLINEKVISDKKIIEHLRPVIINYYENTYLNNASIFDRDNESYREFKRLYQSIK